MQILSHNRDSLLERDKSTAHSPHILRTSDAIKRLRPFHHQLSGGMQYIKGCTTITCRHEKNISGPISAGRTHTVKYEPNNIFIPFHVRNHKNHYKMHNNQSHTIYSLHPLGFILLATKHCIEKQQAISPLKSTHSVI